MKSKDTQSKLRELARCVAEPIPPDLKEKIRRNIPTRLHHHWGKDAVNIIIHLRISRVTAIVAILLTLVICWIIFGDAGRGDGPLYGEFISLDWLPRSGADHEALRSAFETRYRWLIEQGYEAEYYGNIVDFENPNDIILYWCLEEDRYRVIYADLRPSIVSARELIHLQTRMLKNRHRTD